MQWEGRGEDRRKRTRVCRERGGRPRGFKTHNLVKQEMKFESLACKAFSTRLDSMLWRRGVPALRQLYPERTILKSSYSQFLGSLTRLFSDMPNTIDLPGGIPDTHRPHTEGTTTILVPKDNVAFLNPEQEFTRDLSVAGIRTWNEMRKEEQEARSLARGRSKKRRGKKGTAVEEQEGEGLALM